MNRIMMEDINNICEENIHWEKIKNKSILITGATGYLATYIILTLINRNKMYNDNILIYALCRNVKKAEKIYGELLKRKDIILVIQDVVDPIDKISNVDIVIHAASPANSYINELAPYKVIEANVIGYDNLLKNCHKWGTKKIIYFSSGTVYGNNTPYDGVNEEYRDQFDFCNTKNCYRLSKQMCEMMTSVFSKQNPEIEMNTIRPFIVYGPGQVYSQKKVITDFLNNYLNDQDIVIKSDGKAVRSYIYIKDAIKGFFYILLNGENRKAYNISSTSQICNISELANVFVELNKKLKIVYEEVDEGYLSTISNCFTGKNSELVALGWKEETDLMEGIKRTIEWARVCDYFYD